jgi:LacI family transcriptional regulator
LLVSSSHDSADEAATMMRSMQGRVDGLVILSTHVDAAFLRANLPDSLPAVLLNSPVKSSLCGVINVDNVGGAYAMTRHLLGTGKGNVAFIAGPADNFDAQQRDKGYRAAMAKYAPKATPVIIGGDFTEESGYRAGRELLALKIRPRAIFAANDMMAVGCLYAFADAGVSVPDEIALAGFDDIPIARYVVPPLTTVRMHISDLGRTALESLAGAIEKPGDAAVAVQTLGCEIVIRKTCGAAAEKAPGANHTHKKGTQNKIGTSTIQ